MNRQEKSALFHLLKDQRTLCLAVRVGEEPVVGLVPYVLLPDFRGLLIHVSRLARHSSGLQDGVSVGILIHQQDQADLSALQLARISLQGKAHAVRRSDPDYGRFRKLYLNRFPESSVTFELGDFELYRIEFEGGRYVAGFARAADLLPSDLAGLAGLAQGD